MMNKPPRRNYLEIQKTSFGQILRLIFVIFSLYLMGDAFSRWDGFSYYASFSEFLPSVALASIIWSIVAVIASLVVWVLLRIYDGLIEKAGWKFNSQHLIFCAGIFLLFGMLVWKGKKLIWPAVETTSELKIVVLVCVVFVSILFSVLLRKNVERWLSVVQERITPLVWLFGLFILFAVPIVGYHAWFKNSGFKETHQFISSADKNSPNVILVTFDALTARNMSLYGYQRETTPFIKEWAKKATVFTKTEAESNFTTSATAGLMTGKRVWSHRTFQIEGTPVKSSEESLPAVLKGNGYYNMAFVVNPHTSVELLGMANSFDIAPIAADFSEPASLIGWQFGYLDVFLYRLFGNKIRMHNWVLKSDFILRKVLSAMSSDFADTTVPTEIVINRFLEAIDNNPQTPFFAWVHIFPPHDPYLPPEPFKGLFSSSEELKSFKAQEEIKLESYKYLFEYLEFPEEMQDSVDIMRDYYDEFIRYCDQSFQSFIAELNNRGMENTIVILSADHGESFDHRYFTHGGPFLYEQVTHIPLVIKEPGQTEGRVVHDLVEQIDISATILDLVDIKVPSWMEGRSLMPLLHGEKMASKPAFSMNFEENPSRGHLIESGSVAVWKGNYKLIHYLEKNQSLLFNLQQDPDELDNLIDREPEVGQHLTELIQDKLEMANQIPNTIQ